MTNKDFYGDELLAVALENTCRKLRKAVYGENCVESNCKDCEFYTVQSIENWLNAEHEEPEPPLLENGEGLKPGDVIMVRNENDEDWEKRSFMCYFQSLDNPFVTLGGMPSWYIGTHECWHQARLPEEGE